MTPIYRNIITFIENNIDSGVYPKNGIIPSESEFCKKFDTSRMTVRKALDELVSRGRLYKLKGRGAFVSNIEFDKLFSVQGFTQIMTRQGLKTSTSVLRFTKITANERVAKALRIGRNAEVYELVRVRYIMDEAVAIEKVMLSVDDYPNLTNYDFAKNSLYDVLEKKYKVSIDKVHQTISTKDVEGEKAEILFGKKQAVAMRVKGVLYDKAGKPIEFEDSVYNGYKYMMNIVINSER